MFIRLLPASRRSKAAFTLIELLVVISIIAILAGLLLPALSRGKINAQMKMAQAEEGGIVGAIEQYFATYSRLPASTNAVAAALAATANSNDFTYGSDYVIAGGSSARMSGMPVAPTAAGSFTPPITQGGAVTVVTQGERTYQNNNSELMAILRDDNFLPEVSGNLAHIYNPQQSVFLNVKPATGSNAVGVATGSPGLGTDEVLRDPWGLPYMISEDLNYDNHVFDAYLSQIYNNKYGTNLLVPAHAVVWSFGPFKTLDFAAGWKTGQNKYMVTSF